MRPPASSSARPTLIVFDCDGVMFDSREANRKYYNDILLAFQRPPMDEEELDFVHCHSVNDAVAHIFRNHPGTDLEAVNRHRTELSYQRYLKFMIIEPDLVEFLETVRPHCRLAISTNRTTTMRPLLRAYGLADYFELVVTAMDVDNPKPAPDALLMILAHFGCSPAEAIFVGDSIIDQLHAARAGVDLIAFRNRRLQARYHVRSFRDILALEPFAELRC